MICICGLNLYVGIPQIIIIQGNFIYDVLDSMMTKIISLLDN